MICPLSPALFVGLAAFHAFAILLFVDPALAPLPLAAFLLCLAVAPFLTGIGFFLPITTRGKRGERGVSLTFDDGPDPEVTPRLLELLDRRSVPATFFVMGEKAARHPDIIRDILSRGHSIGNHSFSHMPFLMLKGIRTLRREVESTQSVLRGHGVVPLAFRPPVGITNPHLWRVLLEQGMFCVNFSCRAVDFGNRRIARLSGKILRKVSPGDIVALHDVSPRREKVERLLEEFDSMILGMKEKGLEIVPMSRLIGKEVMRRGASGAAPHPAARFYDDLAADYDREQFQSVVSLSRRRECELFEARVPELFSGAGRVLEIGAGTGIFTLDIARHCREVVALDVSAGMLEILERKAREAGLANIRTVTGNAETEIPEGTYSVACAFSSLAYLSDLPAFFRRLASRIDPGGSLYFITAHRSLLRVFTQIGNAMRQGLWLKAYSRREIRDMLADSGFEKIRVSSHLFKSWFSGGILLEAIARRKDDRTEPAC
jgi:peptidoglycan/xylan/chitin deacetylase (PgdA/CDA1 family)/ubiquinone/menaquinone biosynthesis C-methylase UbiE